MTVGSRPSTMRVPQLCPKGKLCRTTDQRGRKPVAAIDRRQDEAWQQVAPPVTSQQKQEVGDVDGIVSFADLIDLLSAQSLCPKPHAGNQHGSPQP
jgi:hypothetical protein